LTCIVGVRVMGEACLGARLRSSPARVRRQGDGGSPSTTLAVLRHGRGTVGQTVGETVGQPSEHPTTLPQIGRVAFVLLQAPCRKNASRCRCELTDISASVYDFLSEQGVSRRRTNSCKKWSERVIATIRKTSQEQMPVRRRCRKAGDDRGALDTVSVLLLMTFNSDRAKEVQVLAFLP
jgi:hypothetical protein